MKLIRGIHNLCQTIYGCVLTIGNFDGVHRGHQALLRRLKEEGNTRDLPVVVIIFEPQPLEFFFGKKAPARLTGLREKLCYLSQFGIDYTLCIRFDWKFSQLSATNFIKNLLLKRLGVQFIIIGDDFRFGSNRKGDFFLLKKAGLKYGFDVTIAKNIYDNGKRISSTAIRKALAEDKLDTAENLLGHPFVISGRVVHGRKLGRSIGFPTVNLLHHQTFPIRGVYAVEVAEQNKILRPGIANIGTRPTVLGVNQQLEVYLLDTTTIDLYNHHLNVILRKKIRNEQRFTSLNELKSQIICDELMARDFFKLF